MSPLRRATDTFDPKPMPTDPLEREQQQWHMLQMTVFQLSRMNGTVAEHSTEIVRIDKDVSVAKRLGWIALVVLGLVASIGGACAAIF